MTRLQQELARKLHTLECASRYEKESGILHITLGDKPICRIYFGELEVGVGLTSSSTPLKM